jgi:tetratricopeptide (TPR) repeat protein
VVRWLAILVVVLGCADLIHAAEPSRERVQRLYDQAQAQYRDGKFAEAATLLRELYALEPQPILLYNLARAYEGAGDLAQTIEAYERYLGAVPAAPNRREIRQRVATLRRQLEEREALEQAARQRTPPNEPAQPMTAPPLATSAAAVAERPRGRALSRGRRAAPWSIVGVGALTLGAGGLLGGLAVRENNAAAADPLLDGALAHRANADRLALGANISFGIGGAALAIGTVWGLVDVVRSRRSITTR